MKYKIKFKGLDDADEMRHVKQFLASKGLYPVGNGLTLDLFVEEPNPTEDALVVALEVDVMNKTLYYGYNNYDHEQDIWEDYGTLLSIDDDAILEFFDKLGYRIHEDNEQETGQSISDWF